MWSRIVAFFTSFIAFFASLFGIPFSDGHVENDGYIYTDMQYGYHYRQKVDLCLPSESDGQVGLILFIHGGAWISGDKDSYSAQLCDVAENYGYAAAALNYRYISEDISVHDILDDIDACLLRIKEVAAEKGIVVDKVLLTGGSAGAHLAMLYAYSRCDTAPITPAAVVSYSGPTDLTDENYYKDNLLGDEETVAGLLSSACGKEFTYENRSSAQEALLLASPIYYVNENTVPTVINHGKKDNVVPYSNALTLAAIFERYGINFVLNCYPDSGHGLESNPEDAQVASELFEQYALTYLGREK